MINKKFITSCLLILSSTIGYSLTTQQVEYSQKAIDALAKKDYKSYYYYKSKLKDTSIYPYLQYKEISTDPDIFQQTTIDEYFKQDNNSYWQNRLSDDLAQYYAQKQEWKLFDKYYKGDLSISGKCWSMQAEYESGDKNKALNEYGQLWQNRVYMPAACNPMQKYWDNSDYKPSSYLTTKAYTLAFANKFDDSLWLLNTYVKDNKDYLNYITAWKQATKDPRKLDSFINRFHNYNHFDKVFVDISRDLIRKDVESYAKVWNNLKNKRYLSTKVKQQTISAIAVSFARSQSPQAQQWLSKVDKNYLDTTAWEWLLRVDLYNENFKDYIQTYNQLPKNSQQDQAWRYWLAYSYQQTGQKAKAEDIFESLTKTPLDYYSFLAADKLGKPYNFGNDVATALTNSETKKLLTEDTTVQAIDLYQIGQYKDSTSIWQWAIRNKLRDKQIDEIKQLARLAEDKQMYYAAIFNMSVIGSYNSIDMLFPKAFINIVNQNAQKFAIDKDLVLSIMRKESLFDISAGSSAGAKGLMQVTEPTAKFIAQKYKLSLVGDSSQGMTSQIFIPENNIKLGTANLYFLEKLFDKNPVLGIAAYNAGPGNVAKWLNENEVPAAIWIENIPFGETRHYVRKVLMYMIVYNNFVFKDKKDHISNFLGYKISDKQSFRK
ncbi:lytic transglycosylase domain-containing protein [Francisella tularensis]|uniref:Soluble lytic murein transglycosylase n=2 Tax=Francisella tularensis subsp. tularensis (strain SCHU S4 / Schu 4) TaxID=177416 RepID=Q5NHP7_FRATT|nr:lytic transglycosylase domain-containing protein [Francisella tularensis]AFB78567.1 Soluble lytic murein transglycosylase precursor [Francisella tularensis subsp. tularensis TIGB03]AFB80112.1 Soluble lytic murein transglycosylase precursor [Francisella tularensis subsp. tularensis TI0902]AJI69487.1 transglycosylase SLT domain protein [Francisella tularensis subsp. tularensis SCHU S4]AJI72015.1 transglycosylase SLT domain protein [Francisella tularensis subsp. tularensis]AKZ19515.1 Soluble l